jgi:His/Glu/Gln/Arg/opine family amino acid ABC transporter permease subunit
VNTDVLISWLRILGTGFVVTVQVSALTLIFSVILAVILAVVSVSPWRPLRFLAAAYVDLLRSIPILALAISVYFGLGATLYQLGITPFGTAVLVLTAIESAYLAELYRGSLEAIRRPQWDAAASLGLGWTRTVWHVILPQALPPAVPITLNMAIAIIKDSSLVSLIAVSEVTLVANQLIAETFEPVPVYLLAALLYVLLIIPLSQVSRRIEAVVAHKLGLQPRTDRDSKLQRLSIEAEARAG